MKCHQSPVVYREILEAFKIFPFHLEEGKRFGLTRLSGNLEWLTRLVEKAGKDSPGRLRWGRKKDGDVARFIRESYGELHRMSKRGAGNVPCLRQESNGVFVDFAPKEEVRWLDMECHKDSAVYRDILDAFKIFPPQLGKGSRFGLTPLSGDLGWLPRLVEKCPPARLRWAMEKGEKDGDVARFIRESYGELYGKASGRGAGNVPCLRQESNGVFVDFAPKEEVRWLDMECHKDSAVHRDILDAFKIFPPQLGKGSSFGLTPVSGNLEWLPRLVEKCPPARLRWRVEKGEEGGDIARFIRRSYRGLYDKCGPSLRDALDVPYLRQESNRDVFVAFAPRKEVHCLDMKCQQDAAVYRDILGAFKIFPFQLEAGKFAGLAPLPGGMEWLHRVVEKAGKDSPDRLRWDTGQEGNMALFIGALYDNKEFGARMRFAPFLRRGEKGVFVNFAAAEEVRWADKHYYEDGEVKPHLLAATQFKIFPWFLNLGQDFGLSPLSADMRGKPLFGPDDDDETKEMRKRFGERRMALKALLDYVVKPDKSKLPSESDIRALDSLELELMDGAGKTIVNAPIDAYLEGGVIYVNGKYPDARWRALAVGLDMWWENTEYQDEFENLLEKPDYVKRLRKRGISEEVLKKYGIQKPDDSSEQPPAEVAPTPPPAQAPSPVVSAPMDAAPSPSPTTPRTTVAFPSPSAPPDHEFAGQPAQASSFPRPPTVPELPDSPPSNPSASASTGVTRGWTRTRTRPTHSRPPGETTPWTRPEETTPAPRTAPSVRQPAESKHKALQDEIHRHPEKIGLPGAKASYYAFRSGDKVDLLFTTDSEYVAVEVKTRDCSPAEIERGVYQCVKYDALLKAAIQLEDWPLRKGRTILALGGKFPAGMGREWRLLKAMDIEILESLSDSD